MLQETFTALTASYSVNWTLIDTLWKEIDSQYSAKSRHYHTLSHLENMLSVLKEIESKISDWDTTLFALFYHDIIYRATSSKNEEESAEKAAARCSELAYAPDKITKCKAIILATKGHGASNDVDTNYFTDADLSILGQPADVYFEYTRQIRKEYSIYPAFVYNAGRKKVVQHFLQMKCIFKTDYFSHRFEASARKNLEEELSRL